MSGEGLGPHGLLTALKGITVGSTLVTFFFLYQYYDAAISLRRLSGVRLGSGVSVRSLRGAGLLYQFVLEIAIMIPQPLPGVDATFKVYNKGLGKYSVYSVDSIMCVAMFVRLAYLPRFYGEVVSDLRSDAALAISRVNSVVFDNAFVVRYVLANSLNCVVLVTSLLIILFAYMMMVFERPVDNGTLGNYANCVWLVIITMTTVGYGDEFPTTVLGRFVAVMASLTAVVLLAVTTNLVVSQLTLSRSEAKVIEVMETISLRDELRESAAVVVQRWMRAYLGYMRKNRGGGGQRGSSNKAIKSATRLNIDLCAAVLSDVELLESISSFKDANAAHFSQRLQVRGRVKLWMAKPRECQLTFTQLRCRTTCRSCWVTSTRSSSTRSSASRTLQSSPAASTAWPAASASSRAGKESEALAGVDS